MLQSSSVYLYQGYASLGSSQPVIYGMEDVEADLFLGAVELFCCLALAWKFSNGRDVIY